MDAFTAAERAFANGYSSGYAAGRRSAGATGSLREQTVADSIRSKSDEDLAYAIHTLYSKLAEGALNDLSDLFCDGKNGCFDKDGNITCTPEMERACVLRWLRSLAKEMK